jgi:hypothetical protein
MVWKMLTLAVAGLSLCSTAAGKNPARGFFVGVDAGQAQLDGEVTFDPFYDVAVGDESLDDTAATVTLHAGYRFSRFLSLGVVYSHFDDFSGRVPTLCPGSTCAATDIDMGLQWAGANFVARVPIGQRLALLGTASALFHDLKLIVREPGEAPSTYDDGGLIAKVGIGLGYKIDEHLDLSVDVGYADNIGNAFMSFLGNVSGTVTTFTAGLRYKF